MKRCRILYVKHRRAPALNQETIRLPFLWWFSRVDRGNLLMSVWFRMVFLWKALAKVWNKVARSARNPRPKAQVFVECMWCDPKHSAISIKVQEVVKCVKCGKQIPATVRPGSKVTYQKKISMWVSSQPRPLPYAVLRVPSLNYLCLQIEDYQIARKQPPHPPPSFSIFYLWFFSVFVYVFRFHLYFNQTFCEEVPVGGMEFLF